MTDLRLQDTTRKTRLIAWIKLHQSRLVFWLRLGIALSLMGVVIALVGQDKDKLTNVNWTLVPLAWLLMLASTCVKAFRWSLLVRQSHMDISFRGLLSMYLVGAFFSTVLPTSVGGDAVRAVDTATKTGRAADATSSVLIERGIGLLVVIGSGSVVAATLEPGQVPLIFQLLIHAMFAAGLVGLVILRQGWFLDPIAAVMTRFGLHGPVKKVHQLQTAFSGHLGHPLVLVAMVLLSIIANALTMGATYLVLVAVTDKIPIGAFVPMIALTTAAELIPISVAALGVKESAYIFFLGLAGVGSTEAGVIAIIMRVLTWGHAMVGGLVYISRTLRTTVKDNTAGISLGD